LNEFAFRYDHRKMPDSEQLNLRFEGKGRQEPDATGAETRLGTEPGIPTATEAINKTAANFGLWKNRPVTGI
jgi:hypothetical protein